MSGFSLLTALILTPVVAALVVMLIPDHRRELVRPLGVVLSLLPIPLAVGLFLAFERGEPGFQFVEQWVLIGRLGVEWHLGVDGISLLLVLLTTVLVPIALAASGGINHRIGLFVAMNLLLEAGLIGVFLSLDLFLFFVFFEAILVPMALIIGIWGSENRVYAAVKFFLYTALGSALMLAGIIALALIHRDQMGFISFSYFGMLDLDLGVTAQRWLFGAFLVAFAIKVPVFPLHTWLPDAHVEAPTAGSVLLAGVLLKLGTYGLLRFNLPLFPEATLDFVPLLATLAVIGVIYGAVVAIVQHDLKKLVAYSSVSHLGFIVLGTFALTSQSLEGSVIQMVNHGLTTGALFLLVGMIYERRHTKKIADFGGLASSMPVFAGVFLFIAFASIGLPGLNGFVGEFLILIGSYPTLPVYTVLAATGVILAAIYLLWAYERVFTGEITDPANRQVKDLSISETLIFVPLVALIIVLGVYPKVALDVIGPSTDAVLERVEATTDFSAPQPGNTVATASEDRR
ncbi:MAG: NADH-quinone oxidoreductase subunit M [bacterium]|nr:NADH-quinone oxidoreductase subunit M [bacterium]